MIDRRERKETYEIWTQVIWDANQRLLDTHIPDTKHYNRELSPTRNDIFRSTLFPPDNREMQNSGLVKLLDEIYLITNLESPATL